MARACAHCNCLETGADQLQGPSSILREALCSVRRHDGVNARQRGACRPPVRVLTRTGFQAMRSGHGCVANRPARGCSFRACGQRALRPYGRSAQRAGRRADERRHSHAIRAERAARHIGRRQVRRGQEKARGVLDDACRDGPLIVSSRA